MIIHSITGPRIPIIFVRVERYWRLGAWFCIRLRRCRQIFVGCSDGFLEQVSLSLGFDEVDGSVCLDLLKWTEKWCWFQWCIQRENMTLKENLRCSVVSSVIPYAVSSIGWSGVSVQWVRWSCQHITGSSSCIMILFIIVKVCCCYGGENLDE